MFCKKKISKKFLAKHLFTKIVQKASRNQLKKNKLLRKTFLFSVKIKSEKWKENKFSDFNKPKEREKKKVYKHAISILAFAFVYCRNSQKKVRQSVCVYKFPSHQPAREWISSNTKKLEMNPSCVRNFLIVNKAWKFLFNSINMRNSYYVFFAFGHRAPSFTCSCKWAAYVLWLYVRICDHFPLHYPPQ